jgi:coenzyme F420-reducing hydrogenase delta subunit
MLRPYEEQMHAPNPQQFEPKIVAFVCTWCTYAGADLAGTSRLQYPSNVRVVKFPCTGRIDPLFILRAFQKGADGVLVSGCHPGDCHYMAGNFHARRRFAAFRQLLDFVGVDLKRLHFSWVSAAEGGKWVEVVTDLTEAVRSMGPMPEFKALEAQEHWSSVVNTPELQESYNAI